MDDDHITETLNEYFRGWIFIDNLDPAYSGIYNVKEYEKNGHGTVFSYLSYNPKVLKEQIKNSDNIDIKETSGVDAALYRDDIIYKILEVDEEQEVGKVRWYYKGKLEKLTTKFEMFEKIKWYHKGDFEEDKNLEIHEYEDFITFPLFREFLIDHKTYDKYIRNCYDEKLRLSRYEDFIENFDDEDPKNYIIRAFDWQKSPETLYYWDDLNDDWVDKLYSVFFK